MHSVSLYTHLWGYERIQLVGYKSPLCMYKQTANCSKECSLGFGSLSKYLIAALFHKPLGGTGGSADANGVYIPEPFHVYLVGTLYLVRVRIHT